MLLCVKEKVNFLNFIIYYSFSLIKSLLNSTELNVRKVKNLFKKKNAAKLNICLLLYLL